MADEGVKDWHSVEKLLSDWSKQAAMNRNRSARKAKFYRRLHYVLGTPVVIFSSIVGSTAFAQIGHVGNNDIRVFAGVLSIISAVLAGLQTFFAFGESAEKFRAAGVGFERIEKEIEEIQALPAHLRGEVKERIDELRDEMDSLSQGLPDIPRHEYPPATSTTP